MNDTNFELQFTIYGLQSVPVCVGFPVCNATPSPQSSPIKGEEEKG